MIGWIKNKFNDIRFRNKLLLSHLVIALIPILLLGLLSFIQSYRIQMKELRSEAEASLEQVANIMDYKINRYNTLSEFMVLNRDLSQIFIKDYEENYFNMYLDFRDILESLISNIRLMDEDIEAITFIPPVSCWGFATIFCRSGISRANLGTMDFGAGAGLWTGRSFISFRN